MSTTQSKVRKLHTEGRTVAEMAADLGITAGRIRRLHQELRLLPHPPAARTPKRGDRAETREQIERRIVIRRAAVSGYWRQHPTATAGDVAHALGHPEDAVRYDRVALGLSVRRDADSAATARRLAADGVMPSEIARRLGIGLAKVREALAEG